MRFCSYFFLVIAFFIGFGSQTNAQQQHYFDSLRIVIQGQNDTLSVKSYNGLSWAYKFSYPDSAIYYANKALALSENIGFTKGKTVAMNRISDVYIKKGEYDQAVKILLEAIELSKQNNQTRILLTSYRQLGKVYERQGNLSVAMNNYYRSLRLADSIQSTIGIARASLRIATAYHKLGKDKIAEGYLNYAIDEFAFQHYNRGLHAAYVLRGDIYANENLLDSASLSYQTAEQYLAKLRDKLGKGTILKKQADVLFMRGQYAKALTQYTHAAKIFKITEAKRNLAEVQIALANTYLTQRNYTKALEMGLLTLEQSKEWNLLNEHKNSHYLLYKIYKEMNRPSESLAQLEEYQLLLDSLLHVSEDWRIEQMNKSFELEIQQKENELNSVVIKNQQLALASSQRIRNLLITLSVVVTLFLLVIGFGLHKSRKTNKLLKQAIQDKNDAISLISHDLKSPFNKINGLVHVLELQLTEPSHETLDILNQLKTVAHEGLGLVQNLVDVKALQAGEYTIKLSDFNLNDYLQKRVETFRQVAKSKSIALTFTNAKDNCRVVSDANSIARIFDNLLSNAIKFSPKGEAVTIDCTVDKERFSFSVSDNGKGVSKKEIDEIFKKHQTGIVQATGTELSNGLGLAIVASLTHKLQGEISCISEPNHGATFIVTLPNLQEQNNG